MSAHAAVAAAPVSTPARAPSASRPLQRKCACGGHAVDEPCVHCSPQPLQAKLVVGDVDDPFEREADAVASDVLRSPASPVAARPMIRRLPSSTSPSATGDAPASVDRVVASQGEPLAPAVRDDMERRIGHDFSRVRVHRDALADRSARELGAFAYTVGDHIAFASSRYEPATRDGRHLLAHELTHVVQQGPAGTAAQRIVRCGGKKGPTTKPHSCGGWTCAPMADCPNPDGKSAPSPDASTAWSLTANLDLDVLTADDITGADSVGHAFVEFKESNGDRYTYGHYPGKGGTSPEPVFHPQVPGCTAHPDQTHSGCVDMRVGYALTQAEYTKALDFAKAWCVAGQPYHILTNNCTTFVERVVGVAGKSLPSSRGSVGHGAYHADNPNTLFDTQLSQADNATWRGRVSGDFTGHYDAAGKPIAFTDFKLKTDDTFAVAGKYAYTGSTGDRVEGTLDGRLVFDVDPATKAVAVTVGFTWTEPSGSGKGTWTVDATGALKGTWGRGGADTGGGGWELAKAP